MFVALATPLGVTIGLVVTEHVDATSGVQTLVIGILQVRSTDILSCSDNRNRIQLQPYALKF